jgi:hypothetical protein
MAYTLELYFTGLCAFVPDEAKKECTVLLVRADDPQIFDPEFLPEDQPNKHRPLLIIPSVFLAEDNARDPDFLVPDGDGHTVACFFVEKEDLQLEVTEPADLTVETGPLNDSFEHVVPLMEVFSASGATNLKASALDKGNFTDVVTRCGFKNGTLKTHRLAERNGAILEFDFRPFSSANTPSLLSRRKISDFCLLELQSLVTRAQILSNAGKPPIQIFTESNETIRAYLTNYDQTIACPGREVLDFLWYYRIADFGRRPTPTHSARVVPVDSGLNSPAYTPQSCTCPPCVVKPPATGIIAASLDDHSETSLVQVAAATQLGISLRDLERLTSQVDRGGLLDVLSFFPYIFRGIPADGRFPECVGIRRGAGSTERSGVLLDSSHVLTAKHHLEMNRTYRVEGTTAMVKGKHPYADLAILKLTDPSTISPPPRGSVALDDTVTVVGMGDTSTMPSSGQKTFGTMVVRQLDIGTKAPHQPTKSKHEMRAEPAIQSACPYDSGGPVFVQRDGIESRELVAIILGPFRPSVLCTGDAILVRLEPFEQWIRDVLAAA